MLLTGTGYALAGWSTPHAALSLLPWLLLVRGIGTPLVMQTAGTAGLQGIRGRALPTATTLNVVTRNVTAALAIAGLTTLLQGRIGAHVAALGRHAARTGSQPVGPGAHVGQAVLAAQALAYHDVYVLVALVVVPVLVLAVFVRRSAGRAAAPRTTQVEWDGRDERDEGGRAAAR